MKTIFYYLLILCFSCSLFACGEVSLGDRLEISPVIKNNARLITTENTELEEVTAPQTIQELGQNLTKYQPEVRVIKPKNDEIYQKNEVEVQLRVKNLPIFKNEEFGLGSHLNLILDNESDQTIYNLNKPLLLRNLSPGTHTIRVFAAKPWDESFKNEEAYAETTFHILTKTNDNNPDENMPLLTYNVPQGSYGAEPILLDFYLNQAAQTKLNGEDRDCFIKVTVNGKSFVIKEWQPLYLKGFKPGNNWVKLELIDREGNLIKNAFNQTIKLVNYVPENKDTLAKLTTGKLTVAETLGIVDRNYQPKPITAVEETEKSIAEPEIESDVKTKSSENQEKTTVKPKVNYTPPGVVEELNPATEEVVETKETTLEAVPVPETSKELENTKSTAEKTTAKPKVNYTPPGVVEELNPAKEEVVETRETNLEAVPTPEKSKLEETEN
ncbi:MAG: hypothetical protein AB4368_13490 [Xenococcaceae cyanobacterium]